MPRYNNRPQGNYGNDAFGQKAAGDLENYARRGYRGTNDAFYIRRDGRPLFAPKGPVPYSNNRNGSFKGGSPTAHK